MMDGGLLLLSYDGDDDNSVDGNDVSRSDLGERSWPMSCIINVFMGTVC